jgi:signal transduction histidine kinase
MCEQALERLRLEVEALRAARRRLLSAADDDRRRLERELHDGVQQHLVALAANLQLERRRADEDGRPAGRALAEAQLDVRRALAAAAALAHRIYPPLLESGGLVAAVRAAAVHVGRPIAIDIATEADLPAELASTVYFCCVEVVEGGTAPVRVVVREAKNAVVFELDVDDVSPQAAVSEATLRRVRDRVEALGGDLTARVEPSRGAWFRASLPLA